MHRCTHTGDRKQTRKDLGFVAGLVQWLDPLSCKQEVAGSIRGRIGYFIIIGSGCLA